MKTDKKLKAACEKLHANDEGYKTASNIDFLLFICGLIIALFAIRAFIFEPVRVDGTSMQNTLQDGERCIVEKVGYWFAKPKQGDIVIIHYPGRGAESFVKRVIATEGQTIELRHEPSGNVKTDKRDEYSVYIDGEKLDESRYSANFLFDPVFYSTWTIDAAGGGTTFTVPEGCVFVMGDHRTNSQDSRRVGPIELSNVVGQVHGVLYPFDKMRSVD